MTTLAPHARPGGSTNTETMIRDLHRLMAHHNVAVSPSKVNRLVRGFLARITGWQVDSARMDSLFGDWLEYKLDLSIEQRLLISADPDFGRITSYLDPTGEVAVSRTLRTRGY